MKYEEIQEMLDRYWEGETTLEEERRIKTYFNSGPIDERLRPVSPMFQALREEQSVQLATKVKAVSIRPQMYQWAVAASVALLLAAGWWMFREENTTAPIVDNTPNELPKVVEDQVIETPQKSLVLAEKSDAENPVPRKKSPAKREKPSPTIDPETAQAMAEIKAALALVSSKLDKGRNQAIKGATHLEALDRVPKRKEG
ncbi:MAG: hypothetical protein Q7T20_14700 [Saprospiraceae bacterium]|nr:hypothetical protein [Saprospiraceae bacterium]